MTQQRTVTMDYTEGLHYKLEKNRLGYNGDTGR